MEGEKTETDSASAAELSEEKFFLESVSSFINLATTKQPPSVCVCVCVCI